MGAGVVKPEQNGLRIHIHTGSQSMGSHHSADIKCEECAVKFSPFRKQLACNDCGRRFCSVCSVPSGRQCKKCNLLLSGHFTRPQLKQWKPKDLKALLHKHDVNTSKCHEKDDLIDLIFTNFGSTANLNRRGPEQERHVEDLADRMRQQNQSEQQSNTAGASQYSQNGTQSNESGSGTSEPVEQPATQSNESGSGTSNQSGTGNQPVTVDAKEKFEIQSEMPRIKLEDIRSEEHIEQLNIKCLKRLLLNNFVDYKGCCERQELVVRVKRLWSHDLINKQKAEEHRQISDDPSQGTSSSSADDELCKICMDAAIDCVLLECGHMVTCTQCGKRLSECPICRQYVIRAVHTFRV